MANKYMMDQQRLKVLMAEQTDIIQRTAEHYKGIEQTIAELRTEVAVWKRAYDSLKAGNEKSLEGHTNGAAVSSVSSPKLEGSPLALCLIDADANLFGHDLLQEGQAGGVKAANLVHQHLSTVADPSGSLHGANIWAVVVLDKATVTAHLIINNICTIQQFDAFCTGFNSKFPLFSLLDAGNAPEAVHTKVQEYLRTFARLSDIRRIFLCGHPERSYRMLLRSLQNESTMSKVVILEGTRPISEELSRLPSHKIPNLFFVDPSHTERPSSKPCITEYTPHGRDPGSPFPGFGSGTNAFSWRSTGAQNRTFTPPGLSGPPMTPESRSTELDPNLPISKQDPPPCNWFYLARCNKGPNKCPYSHSYTLTKEQIDEMRARAKRSPCMTVARNGHCALGERCILGHYCPNGPNCHYLAQNRCKFTGRYMHDAAPQFDFIGVKREVELMENTEGITKQLQSAKRSERCRN